MYRILHIEFAYFADLGMKGPVTVDDGTLSSRIRHCQVSEDTGLRGWVGGRLLLKD